MNTEEKRDGPIQRWGKKINWERRVKAVCKPCWEIKYCPYGPLVEDFPLRSDRDERSCRIYGHDCPVFSVCEPFTETKELRNVSRQIPRVTQFRVLKRENQICSSCGNSVKDEDVEFDHIIPWSKGGSSDENNVRLLCRNCNRKRGTKFEEEYLISSIGEHVVEPIGIEVVLALIEDIQFAHGLYKEEQRYPNALDICKFYGRRKVRYEDEITTNIIANIDSFFHSTKPREMKQTLFNALKYRWGFSDRKVYTLQQASEKFGVITDELLLAELSLINRLGWQVKLTETNKKKWLTI